MFSESAKIKNKGYFCRFKTLEPKTFKMNTNFFVKSHGLGNDYIVLDSENIDFELSPEKIKTICEVHFGIGSDGILLKVPSKICDFGLRIFNPDASEAENCGNGLRIFSKYLFDYKLTTQKHFTIDILGREINCEIIELENEQARRIKVGMGKANFISKAIPVSLDKEECINENLVIEDKTFNINCVSMGNPHCVVRRDNLSLEELLKYGPFIEKHALFPNKTNVQFIEVIDKNNIKALIWERGAGHTLASGSSSCGIASTALKRGWIDNKVKIHLEGGILEIEIDDNWNVYMTGEVKEIANGYLSNELTANN